MISRLGMVRVPARSPRDARERRVHGARGALVLGVVAALVALGAALSAATEAPTAAMRRAQQIMKTAGDLDREAQELRLALRDARSGGAGSAETRRRLDLLRSGFERLRVTAGGSDAAGGPIPAALAREAADAFAAAAEALDAAAKTRRTPEHAVAAVDGLQRKMQQLAAESVLHAEALAARERDEREGASAMRSRLTLACVLVLVLLLWSEARGIARLAAAKSELIAFNASLREEAHAAREAARAKTALLATLSREIRTPIEDMVGAAHLLRDVGPEMREHAGLARLCASGAHALQMIDGVFDLSRLGGARTRPDAGMTDLAATVEATVAAFEAQANEKGLALVADCPEGEAPIDGGRLRQVLDQLVFSAVKRSDRGSVTIHVRRRVEHTGAGWLRVTVADTGGGVTSAARQSLFSDISQAERALGDAGGGSLGLLVSRRIIEEMGGVIGVEPREAGSVFWFEIPLAQAPGPAFAAEPATDTETLADVLQALERRISRDREAPTLIAREASDATGAPRWRIIAADRTLLLIGALSARRIAAACDSMDAHPVAAPADEGAKKLARGAAA